MVNIDIGTDNVNTLLPCTQEFQVPSHAACS